MVSFVRLNENTLKKGYCDLLHPLGSSLLWFAYLDDDLKGSLLD